MGDLAVLSEPTELRVPRGRGVGVLSAPLGPASAQQPLSAGRHSRAPGERSEPPNGVDVGLSPHPHSLHLRHQCRRGHLPRAPEW